MAVIGFPKVSDGQTTKRGCIQSGIEGVPRVGARAGRGHTRAAREGGSRNEAGGSKGTAA